MRDNDNRSVIDIRQTDTSCLTDEEQRAVDSVDHGNEIPWTLEEDDGQEALDNYMAGDDLVSGAAVLRAAQLGKLMSNNQVEQAEKVRQVPKITHKVVIEWETDAHGLSVLGSVIQELEDHGSTTHRIETVHR